MWRQRLSNAILTGLMLAYATEIAATQISGDLLKWHRVTLTFDGPPTSETASPNPFRDYRLTVIFTHNSATYTVPGFYAADGNAADTSASAGNKWRVRFTPDQEGTWNYTASFRTGTDVTLSTSPAAGTPVSFDGDSGSFSIGPTNKTGGDFRGKGILRYVNRHHLRFQETGEYFLKGGADSPENFLGYFEFDGTTDTGGLISNFLHQYQPHASDWNAGDPTWQTLKGKNIIGALNYLAGQGMNSVYFITYNIDGGDGADTWPWTNAATRDRFDCSKLDQWEIVFAHMDALGIQLHLLTQETENDHALDGGNLGPLRKLYYRELIARFGHHLALLWNLGEENTNTDPQRIAFAQYIRDLDPYDHPITVHTFYNAAGTYYDGLLGDPNFEATSIQGDSSQYNSWATALRNRSIQDGRPWAIYGDEQGPAVDPNLSNLSTLRKDTLWGNLMGGGAGVEWYFGYQGSFGDLQSEDWSVVGGLWQDTKHALDFFQDHLPFWQMEPNNSLASGGSTARVLDQPGLIYAVYLPNGGTTSLNVAAATYTVRWYNPRSGGTLQNGSVTQITGPGSFTIGQPPSDPGNDWAALVATTDSPALHNLVVNNGSGDGGYPAGAVVTAVADAPPPGQIFDQWTGDIGATNNAFAEATSVTISSGGVTITATYKDGSSEQAVIYFTLINADTDQPIASHDPLVNGAVLNLVTLPTQNLNIRANTSPATVGSVQFGLDADSSYLVESVAPYALAGDTSGNYNPWTPSLGQHTLTGTPYTAAGAGGTAGTPLTVTFSVVNQSPNEPPTVTLTAPTEGDTFVAPAEITLAATASDSDGNVVNVDFLADQTLIDLDTNAPYETVWSDVSPGQYTLNARARDDDDAVTISDPVSITVIFVGDFDGDGDVDLKDFGAFQACLGQTASACEDADMNGNAFVDAGDLVVFQGCMSGANVPTDPTCLDK